MRDNLSPNPGNGIPTHDYTVTVTVTDDDTGSDTKTAIVTVNNLPPEITIDSIEIHDAVIGTDPDTGEPIYLNPGQLDESEGFTIRGTVTDPGINDTHQATLEIDINFDGVIAGPNEIIALTLTPVPNTPGRWTFEHTVSAVADDGAAYDSNGARVWGTGTPEDTLVFTVRVVDDDGGEASYTVEDLIVHNVPPYFTDAPYISFEFDEDGDAISATIHGAFDDFGTHDFHELNILWGDGAANDGTANPPYVSPGEFSVTRQFMPLEDIGTLFPILVTLRDDDTGEATYTLDLCGCACPNATEPEPQGQVIEFVGFTDDDAPTEDGAAQVAAPANEYSGSRQIRVGDIQATVNWKFTKNNGVTMLTVKDNNTQQIRTFRSDPNNNQRFYLPPGNWGLEKVQIIFGGTMEITISPFHCAYLVQYRKFENTIVNEAGQRIVDPDAAQEGWALDDPVGETNAYRYQGRRGNVWYMHDSPGQDFSLGGIPLNSQVIQEPQPHIRIDLTQDPLTYLAQNNAAYQSAVQKQARQVQEFQSYIVSRATNDPIGYLAWKYTLDFTAQGVVVTLSEPTWQNGKDANVWGQGNP